MFLSLIVPLLYVQILYPAFIKPNFTEPLESTLGLSGMWFITFVLIIYLVFIEKEKPDSIGLRKISFRQFFTALGLGLLLSFLIPAFYFLTGSLFEQAAGKTTMEVSQKTPILVLFGIFTASITEELLIRAYPLERMEKIFSNKWAGATISLIVFVLLHLQSWDLLHITGIVLPLGVALTIIYIRTRSLLFVIITHFVIDFPLFIMSWIRQD